MAILKRIKAGVTHYAEHVGPDGLVALTPHRAKACEVTPEQVEKVKAHCAARPAWGGLVLEDGGKERVLVAEVKRPDPPTPPKGDAAEPAALRKENTDLKAANAAGAADLAKLQKTADSLAADLKAAAAERDELRKQVEQLTAPPKGEAGKGGK